MTKHPDAFRLESPLKEVNETVKEPTVLYDGEWNIINNSFESLMYFSYHLFMKYNGTVFEIQSG